MNNWQALRDPNPMQSRPLRLVLDELDRVLDDERDALRLLDARTVERLAEAKLKLELELRNAIMSVRVEDDAAALERIRAKALDNQVLLIHARNCVRGAIEVATGQQEGYESKPPPRKSMHLDLKG